MHNRIALATHAFQALSVQSEADGRTNVVVVDQHSEDGVERLARDFKFQVVNSHATTAGALRNEGVAVSDSEWLNFIDSDVVICDDYFAKLRQHLSRNPMSLVGAAYTLPENPSWTESAWDALTVQRADGERAWLNAGNVAISRKLFNDAGGFSETLTSGEDTEFCERLARRGVPTVQFVDLRAAHLGNPKGLIAFFQKQVWHGQGARLSNRNTILGVAHACMLLLGAATSWWMGTPSDFLRPTIFLVCANLIPSTVLIVLAVRRRFWPSPLRSLLLLQSYFLARFAALVYRSSKQR